MLIARVAVDDVLPVRQAVLWPDQTLAFSRVADDADGLHYAALHDGLIVGVASLFVRDGTARLRKFAMLPAWQGRGVGTSLLDRVLLEASHRDCVYFWCDARRDAVGFYRRFGLREQGDAWEREGVLFVRMGRELVAS
ncbi:MAG: hypothetical protein BSR46_15160 [Candidatus Dactylopiibacterium carminicum]|nr:MAG: hypothetical protein BSR46_15160 [Candidatus Dactylopiibacterium carminicum]